MNNLPHAHGVHRCQFGFIHSQCDCGVMTPPETQIECSTPEEHRRLWELDHPKSRQGSTWLYRSTDGKDQEALLSVPSGYVAPLEIHVPRVSGASSYIPFNRIKEVEE